MSGSEIPEQSHEDRGLVRAVLADLPVLIGIDPAALRTARVELVEDRVVGLHVLAAHKAVHYVKEGEQLALLGVRREGDDNRGRVRVALLLFLLLLVKVEVDV